MPTANIKPEWLLEMESVLQMLNEGVMIADDGLRLLFVNDALLRWGGYQREDMLGRTPATFFETRRDDITNVFTNGRRAHAKTIQ